MKYEAQRSACQNMPAKPSKTQPGMLPNPPKSMPRASWTLGELKCTQKAPEMSQVAPKSAQEVAKKRPRLSKSRPRAAKSRPRGVQEASKTPSDRSQVEPGTLQDRFGARFWWRALRNRLYERYCAVFCLARNMCDLCKTSEKHRKNCGFCTSGVFAHRQRACMRKDEKTWKNRPLEPPKPSPERP